MGHASLTVTDQNFETEVLKSDKPVLVDFWAEWCPPCKMLAPTLHALADSYTDRMRVGLLDADEHPQFVQQYGVMGLPTLILFQNGEPALRMVGFQPRERIEAQLLRHLQTEDT